MFTIKTCNKIAQDGLNLLNPDHYSISDKDSDAILLRSYSLPENEIDSTVKAIARAGAGVNNIPVKACTERGIVVFNTPGANANSVKELVIAGLLLTARRIHEGISWSESQKADDTLADKVEKEKSSFAGSEIAGKNLGVIGLGAIGVLVANAAVELGMTVYGYDPFISVNSAWGLSSNVHRCDNLDQMMASCDYITLHVPLSQNTKHLINAEKIKKAKKGLSILNFARGGLVDSTALAKALKEGSLHRYVTDFPTPELLVLDSVLNIPHLGASTKEAEINCAIMAVKQLQNFLEQGVIVNSVNFPACRLQHSGGTRLLVANKNVPNMLSQILKVLAHEGLNILEMVNRHRDDIAYNIIDVSTDSINQTSIEKIASIQGVLMTRQIQP